MFLATVKVQYYGFHSQVLSDLLFLYIMYKYHLVNKMSVNLSSDEAAMKLTLFAFNETQAFFCLLIVAQFCQTSCPRVILARVAI